MSRLIAALRWPYALTCALIACSVPSSPTAPPTPRPVASDGGEPCFEACRVRAELGCLEPALVEACVPECLHASGAGLFDPRCPARARSREELAACPRVRCRQ